MNSRAKGARGEREAAAAWSKATGATARRGQQFAGGTDSPDVVSSLEGIHLEVKRVERGNPYDWMEQASRDAGDKLPLVLHRRSFQPWLVIVRLEDVRRLAQEIAGQAEALVPGAVACSVSGACVPAPSQPDGESPGLLPLRRGRGARADRNRRKPAAE